MGYLAAQNRSNDEQTIRQAIVYGTVVASFNVEDFSLNRQRTLTRQEIDDRFNRLKDMVHF